MDLQVEGVYGMARTDMCRDLSTMIFIGTDSSKVDGGLALLRPFGLGGNGIGINGTG